MSSQSLSIALVQTDLAWEDQTANLANLEEKIWTIDKVVDLIILPEMFTTGFSMSAEKLAEPMNLHSTKWMKQMAAQTNAVITGSVIIKENGKFFNRLLWASPEGNIQHYDKRHLFRFSGEDEVFSQGFDSKIFELKGWRIFPQICYDLRFPVFSRNTWKSEEAAYDLVFYIASWPAARSSAWDALLPARAIENLSYSIGVNRVGVDGNKIEYCGGSAAFDFKGKTLAQLGNQEEIQIIKLYRQDLEDYRKKFPAWKDADPFHLEKP